MVTGACLADVAAQLVLGDLLTALFSMRSLLMFDVPNLDKALGSHSWLGGRTPMTGMPQESPSAVDEGKKH
jgi:hypothetical protein